MFNFNGFGGRNHGAFGQSPVFGGSNGNPFAGGGASHQSQLFGGGQTSPNMFGGGMGGLMGLGSQSTGGGAPINTWTQQVHPAAQASQASTGLMGTPQPQQLASGSPTSSAQPSNVWTQQLPQQPQPPSGSPGSSAPQPYQLAGISNTPHPSVNTWTQQLHGAMANPSDLVNQLAKKPAGNLMGLTF